MISTFDYLRSGLAWKLLGWAFTIAPEPEKTAIALLIQQMPRKP